MNSRIDMLAGIVSESSTATATTTLTPIPKTDTPSIRAVPYNANDDPQAADFLAYIWKRMQKDDLVDYYFPGQTATGYANFSRMMSGDAQVALMVTDAEGGQWDKTIAGFITWTSMHLGAANSIIAGFIFFREFWDHHVPDQAAVVAFDHWFGKLNASLVLGICPSEHVMAIRYNKRIGLREMGRLPKMHLYKGRVCDAIEFGMTKEDWEMRHGS